MFKAILMASAAAALFPSLACAVSDAEWLALKDEIRQMKAAYEARIAELESRVKTSEAITSKAEPEVVQTRQAEPVSDSFNPYVSLILQGKYVHMDDVGERHITGFLPAGHAHDAARGFSVDHTELVLSANVDQLFKGYANIALVDEKAEVEEAWFQTLGLGNGFTLKGGRFLSALGYQNEQHPHIWDFADNSLMYKALFGEGYGQDGMQLKWVAPSDLFIEPFVEFGRGANFPGTDRNDNGAGAVAAGVHVGSDVGVSNSWRAGVSYLATRASDRGFEGHDAADVEVLGAFSGNSKTWVADMVWKWAPNGDARERNLKLAAEYFRRNESGTLECTDADPLTPSACVGGLSGVYQSTQSGLYAQAVYQFMPQWRVGYRYDRLWRGDADFLGADIGATIVSLATHDPRRHSLMLDWSPSEFSRLRLQYSRDSSMADLNENQWLLQYVHSLGAHGAHKF